MVCAMVPLFRVAQPSIWAALQAPRRTRVAWGGLLLTVLRSKITLLNMMIGGLRWASLELTWYSIGTLA